MPVCFLALHWKRALKVVWNASLSKLEIFFLKKGVGGHLWQWRGASFCLPVHLLLLPSLVATSSLYS